jgi:hypothetical protein
MDAKIFERRAIVQSNVAVDNALDRLFHCTPSKKMISRFSEQPQQGSICSRNRDVGHLTRSG